MGSIQQVTMGAVCLAAAFAFGSYLNHPGHLNQQNSGVDLNSQLDTAGQPIKSLIAIEPQVEKRPAQTPWMQGNLKARLPMPHLPVVEVPAVDRSPVGSRTGNLADVSQSQGQIPPPSDLSGRLTVGHSQAKAFSQNVVEDVPDFSRQSLQRPAMPTVAGPQKSSVGNLANSFSRDNAAQNIPPIEDAPVFGPTASMDAQPTPDANIRPVQPPPLMSEPMMAKPLIVDDRRTPAVGTPEFNLSTANADTYDTANIDLRSGESLNRFRSAKPVVSVQAETRHPEAGLNSILNENQLGDRASRSGYESGKVARVVASNTNQRRVDRLPFRLNKNARTNLVRLRDQAANKISLKTTQFSDYVVEAGDTLQTISISHFGKPDYYLDIYLANRNQLNSPGELQDGMILRIPVYQ